MRPLYPLKFETIYKNKIWGGQKIKSILGKDFGALPNCGETWEISGVPGNVSIVENGDLKGKSLNELIEEYRDQLVGKSVYEKNGNEFPLLVKFIDASEDLSIQVHPDDELAKQRHNSLGKTEMWYILDSDPGSRLISGFNRELSKTEYQKKFNKGQLDEVLNREKAEIGDVFFLPAGRVHTIGKGLLLAEIQQSSDVTYRIYDFDRVDDQGNKRELHVEQALDAIDFQHYKEYKSSYDRSSNKSVEIVECKYFKTNRLSFNKTVSMDYSEIDSFIIYVIVEGTGELEYGGQSLRINLGDCLLLPANLESVTVVPNGEIKLLESFVP